MIEFNIICKNCKAEKVISIKYGISVLYNCENCSHTEKIKLSSICSYCGGYGWTAEHDNHPHENGDCYGICPVQVQCYYCESTGRVKK